MHKTKHNVQDQCRVVLENKCVTSEVSLLQILMELFESLSSIVSLIKYYDSVKNSFLTFFSSFSLGYSDAITRKVRVVNETYDWTSLLSSISSFGGTKVVDQESLMFSTKMRDAIVKSPSQEEIYHGATCNNFFCTYII